MRKDNHNKRNASGIKVRPPIRERSKPSIDKTLGHDYLVLLLNFRFFIVFFLQILPAISTKSSEVNFMFLTAVFAIFNVNNLNLRQRNSDMNKNRFNCKTFTTEILDISGLDKIMVKWQR